MYCRRVNTVLALFMYMYSAHFTLSIDYVRADKVTLLIILIISLLVILVIVVGGSLLLFRYITCTYTLLLVDSAYCTVCFTG